MCLFIVSFCTCFQANIVVLSVKQTTS